MADIQNFTEGWQGHSGAEVQKFVKQEILKAQAGLEGKGGWLAFQGGNIILYEDETATNPLCTVPLAGDVYSVTITASEPSSFNVLSSDTSKLLTFSASTMHGQIGGEMSPYAEDYEFSIYVDNGTGTWTQKQSGTLTDGSSMDVNIRTWLTMGQNRLRITCIGQLSHQQSSRIFNVNMTTLMLSCNFSWYKAWTIGEPFSIDKIYFSGNLQKVLYVVFDGDVSNPIKVLSFPPGTNYDSVPYQVDFAATDWPEEWDTSAIHTVSLWMEGGGVSTPVFTYNVMCVDPNESNVALICINEKVSAVSNFVSQDYFAYALYGTTDVTFTQTVTDGTSTVETEDTKHGIATQTKNKYTSLIEFETESDNATVTIAAVAGTAEAEVEFPLDNSTAYLPTEGAVFYMNAATRSNNSVDRLYLNNQAQNAQVEHYLGEWESFSFGNTDGWTSDGDPDHPQIALAAKAGCDVYFPDFTPIGQANTGSLTLEMKFKVSNIADYDEPVLTFADETQGGTTVGVFLYPSKLTILCNDKQNRTLQSIGLQENTVHHLTIVFQRGYGGNVDRNLCSIYMNGNRNIHFEYGGQSLFGNGYLRIGQDSTDFFLYMMRVYNKALSSSAVLANFINTVIDGMEFTRSGVKQSNEILNGGNVDYEMAQKAGYQIMVVECNQPIPDIEHNYELTCNLRMEYGQGDVRNFKVTNCRLSYQGTTSHNYYRWNLRFRVKNKLSGSQPVNVWTYGDGTSEQGQAQVGWFDGKNNHPQVADIVAKKNYASAMQGHKMGACGLYDDLYKLCVGELQDEARVAVYQYPVLGFQKWDDGSYTYIGLYTIGPHKGDVNTFGYNKDKWPKLLSLEGPNHAPLGTRFIHPWQNVDYSYSDETLTFGGEEGWDADFAGGLSTDSASDKAAILDMYQKEWRPAYEQVFFCSPYLKKFSELASSWNTLANLNADVVNFRKGTTDGIRNDLLQIYDGSYKLYAYNNYTQNYVEVTEVCDSNNGTVTTYTMLGYLQNYLNGVSNPTTAQLVAARVAKFRAEANKYWSVSSMLFHYCYCVLIAATDNFAKNMYPFKFGTLAQEHRWAFRQDDLDSILDTDNNGQQTKKYSVLPGDLTGDGVQIYQGGNSSLWVLVEQAFPNELRETMANMVSNILTLAQRFGITGDNTHEIVFNVMAYYFWSHSAKYFPQEAYNFDTVWAYITPWFNDPTKTYNAVYPLTQTRGDAQYSERDWMIKHIAFIFSRFRLAGFTGDTGEYGNFAFTPIDDFDFHVVPAIDLYPSLTLGQSSASDVQGVRTEAGEVCTITAPRSGETNVYLHGTDWLSYYGDMCELVLTPRGGTTDVDAISFTGKRLRKVKVGDESLAKRTVLEDGEYYVPFNAKGVNVGNSPALEEIDCSYTRIDSAVDLRGCPRLRTINFTGSKCPVILLPEGAQLDVVKFPDKCETLSLRSLPNLEYEMLVLSAAAKSSVTAFYVFNCPLLNPILVLNDLWMQDNSGMTYLTLTWDTPIECSTEDFLVLYYIAIGKAYDGTEGGEIQVKDKTYGYVAYENGSYNNMAGKPVVEGVVNVNGYVDAEQWEVLHATWSNLTINSRGRIIKFEDSNVKNVCVTNWGGATGGGLVGVDGEITMEQAAKVTQTMVGSKFINLASPFTFKEFRFFTRLTDNYGTIAGYTGSKATHVVLPPTSSNLSLRGMTYLNVIELTNKHATVTGYGQGVAMQNHKSGVKMLLPITTPFTNPYVSSETGNVVYYVPDSALQTFKSAWDSRFTIKPLSEYDGKLYSDYY